MSYACFTWRPAIAHLAILETGHRRSLIHPVGWERKPRDGCNMLSYGHNLTEACRKNVGTTVRKTEDIFPAFVAYMGNQRLLERAMLGKTGGENARLRGKSTTGWVVSKVTDQVSIFYWLINNILTGEG